MKKSRVSRVRLQDYKLLALIDININIHKVVEDGQEIIDLSVPRKLPVNAFLKWFYITVKATFDLRLAVC